jgi:uncharacterized protein (DUF2147 family)
MRLVLSIMASLAAPPAMAQDAVLGTWRTQPDDNGNFGHVRVYECGPAICGQLVGAFDGSGTAIPSDQVGRRIVRDMRPEGGGAYRGGKIYAPDRGRTYDAKMDLAGNTLAVAGCILGICRSQRWVRAGR